MRFRVVTPAPARSLAKADDCIGVVTECPRRSGPSDRRRADLGVDEARPSVSPLGSVSCHPGELAASSRVASTRRAARHQVPPARTAPLSERSRRGTTTGSPRSTAPPLRPGRTCQPCASPFARGRKPGRRRRRHRQCGRPRVQSRPVRQVSRRRFPSPRAALDAQRPHRLRVAPPRRPGETRPALWRPDRHP